MKPNTVHEMAPRFLESGSLPDAGLREGLTELTYSELACATGGQGQSAPTVTVLQFLGTNKTPDLGGPNSGPTITLVPNYNPPTIITCTGCGGFGDLWGGPTESFQIAAIWTTISTWVFNTTLIGSLVNVIKNIQQVQAENFVKEFDLDQLSPPKVNNIQAAQVPKVAAQLTTEEGLTAGEETFEEVVAGLEAAAEAFAEFE
jgi:hypothetical protein